MANFHRYLWVIFKPKLTIKSWKKGEKVECNLPKIEFILLLFISLLDWTGFDVV